MGFRIEGLDEIPRELAQEEREKDKGLITGPTVTFIRREEKEERKKETEELPVS